MGRPTLALKPPVDIAQRLEEKKVAVTAGGGPTSRCYILIGLPCSGKSRWADAMLRNWRDARRPAIVSEDDIITEECDRTGESFQEVLERTNPADHAREMMSRFHQAVGVRRDIIVDRHNLTEADRSNLLLLLPDSYQKVGVHFTVPRAIMLQRLHTRYEETGRTFSEIVVQNMLRKMERPGYQEFDRYTDIDHHCNF